MKRALLANGVQVDEWAEDGGPDRAWRALCLALSAGEPVILCVDDDEHWITAIGLCGVRVIVFDPSRNMGVEVHDRASILTRWANSEGIYYGIGVSK